ncbi:MAG: sulfatase-like hydrolase/transferase [Verrucomicrobiota bacterium]
MIPMNTRFLATLLTLLAFIPDCYAAPKVVVLHGEAEYGSERSMPALAKKLEAKLGYQMTILTSPEDTKDLPDLAALENADLLILYLRFRDGTEAQMAQLQAYFDSGKPALAFRTTSHAFSFTGEHKGWFPPIFGGHYKGHAGNRTGTMVVVPASAASHPIIAGVPGAFRLRHGGTYNAQPLADFARPILFGKTGDLPAEPVAWTASPRAGQRLFYTSLGAEQNFESAAFEKLILNACEWCLGKQDEPEAVKAPALPAPPQRKAPAEAKVLFSGDDLEHWRHWDGSMPPGSFQIDRRADTSLAGPEYDTARWKLDGGSVVARPGYGDILTRESYRDSVYELDFLIPEEPQHVRGQFRGNSGAYIDGKWEIQIIDSFGREEVDDKLTCGAIYGVAAPSVNACGKPGTWQNLQVAANHLDADSALLSVWLNGTQIHDRVRVQRRTVHGFQVGENNEGDHEDEDEEENEHEEGDEEEGPRPVPLFASSEEQAKKCAMDSDFTAVVRFRTDAHGPLFGKVSPDWEHREHDKVLFIADGLLRYDIGFVDEVSAAVEVNDNEWHTAALRQKGETIEIFLDGEKVLEEEFTSPDNEVSVIRVGAGAQQFPEGEARLWDGEIESFQFFDKALSDQDLELAGASEPIERNKPVLAWKNGEKSGQETELEREGGTEDEPEEERGEDEISEIGADAVDVPSEERADASGRPNILFIMSDDHTSQAVGAYGGRLKALSPTPNIDTLARDGMLFENCFVTNSICTPSRATIFTGKYSHLNGVYKFTALDQKNQPVLPLQMQKAGYHTAFFGKYHLHSNPVGLDYYEVLPGQGDYHNPRFVRKGDQSPSGWVRDGSKTRYEGHSSDVIGNLALNYLKEPRAENRPFMLFCHFKAPHDSWEYAERYKDLYADVEIPEPANLFDDYEGRADALRTQLQYIGSDWGNHTNFKRETKGLTGTALRKKQYQLYMQKYLRCVKGVDDNVGRILAYLKESGLDKNTVVIYTGDQGFYLGEHGMYDKRFMYEEALRMPFLVRWPGVVKAGSKSDGMILNLDFPSTMLEIAGGDHLPEAQGESFLPLLEGTVPKDWRTSMYYRYYRSHFQTEPHWGIRTMTHKLIYFNGIDQWEMYDLREDPSEMTNLYNEPLQAETVAALKKELVRLQAHYQDDPDDIGDHPRTGFPEEEEEEREPEEDEEGPEPDPVFVSSEAEAKKCAMDKDFTVFMRFRTDALGPLFGKVSPDGEHRRNDKVLFIEDGLLRYNIGFVDEISAPNEVNDDKWHTAALRQNGDTVEIFLDGESVLKQDFTATDNEVSVIRVGAGADNFPAGEARRFDGPITSFQFFDKALSDQQVKSVSGNTPLKQTRPVLSWAADEGEDEGEDEAEHGKEDERESEEEREEEEEHEAEGEIGEQAAVGGPLRLQADCSEVRFANISVRPLAEVDHSSIIDAWDDAALARGQKIYQGMCFACHGNLQQKGSLPTSRPFWKEPFKNGKDPYRLYLTLKKGYNQMPPQPWLTPSAAYDVIHYIREEFVKTNNPSEYTEITEDYLASLPKGIGTEGALTKEQIDYAKGPKYLRMDFGPMLDWTFEVAPGNIAYKGIAIRLDDGAGGVSRGRHWMVYDHDTMRVAAAWSGDKFIDWKGIAFDQSHGTHTSIVGDKTLVNPVGPGWAHPQTGSWEDPRFLGRDGKPYGPLPRDWVQFKGQYVQGNKVVLKYTVGDAEVLEMPGVVEGGAEPVFMRTLNIGKSSHELHLRISPAGLTTQVIGGAATLGSKDGYQVMTVSAKDTPLRVNVLSTKAPAESLTVATLLAAQAEDLTQYTKGGAPRWPVPVTTEGKRGNEQDPFTVDEITYPADNPYHSWMRIGGFDFLPDGKRAAVATWLGDVWLVDGIDGEFGQHTWKRICTGLFQPLGVKVVDGSIYVTCRDQLAKLHDLNGDEEIDFVECFNNDHQVTEHFHEFAMGLQTDDAGNFYYAKSARHAKTALVPHHGTLLRVSKDGSRTEIVATGFRAANGVCINPDGTFIVTDQEGHWNPKNRINYVREGGFYGNMYGYHDITDSSDDAMEQPLCWITNAFDRSPGELLWVPEDANWGPLNGKLLNLSYGRGRVFVVPHEKMPNAQAQGGMVSLGLDFPTGIMRGRFHPHNGQLYTAGMFAWAGSKHQDGGFYRICATGAPPNLPIELKARSKGIELGFTNPLDPESASKAENYTVKVWDLKRTKDYGSRHFNERSLKVSAASVSAGGRTVILAIPEIAPTWCMEIRIDVRDKQGNRVKRVIHNTVHQLGGKRGAQ